ncbi:MAG UNVERIFIED_CONTAM: conjugal transfer protein TraH [Rickettsiaceae bacterium]
MVKQELESSTDEFKSLLGDEFNLVWKAFAKGAGSDTNFKELMMSVSGTIISKKENGAYSFSYKPSLLIDKDLLEKYIGSSNHSSKIMLYSCDESHQCLNPQEVSATLSPNQTLYGNISKIFEKLVDKVQRDDPNLSDEEKSLISFSTIPILHLIEMELGSKAHTTDLIVRVPEFVEVICYDVITNYMQIILARVLGSVKNLEHAQIDDVNY